MATLDAVTRKKKPVEASAEELAAAELVRMAKERGLSLTGPDGLLKQLTKTVLETALNEEMTDHLGFDKNQAPEDRETTNVRNGNRPKTVPTESTGHVQIEVPRDREGTFEPQRRRLTCPPGATEGIPAAGPGREIMTYLARDSSRARRTGCGRSRGVVGRPPSARQSGHPGYGRRRPRQSAPRRAPTYGRAS